MTFSTLVLDPPWKYTKKPEPLRSGGRGACAEHQYSTMTNAEIAALPVGELAASGAHLYVWVTNPILTQQRESITGPPDVMAMIRGWGFEPKALLTWLKGENGGGMGWYFRGDTEHVVFAVRGALGIEASRRESNVFRGQRGAHSAKPDSFYDLVERVSPGPYCELFARRARFGWDYWGNESLGTVSM